MSGPVFALCGSRSLPASAGGLVARVCAALVRSGGSLVVGCAVGADSLVLSSALSGVVPVSSVRCFAAFGVGGVGSAGAVSAVSVVAAFAAAGGSVEWLVSGALSVPVRARLAARSRAVVSAASAGLVAFLSSPSSRGSLGAASFAAARGLRVVAFPAGFSGAAAPPLGPAGAWVPCEKSGVWASAWVWVPSSLF